MRIYFDNASTTPLHPDVLETMCSVLAGDYGNPSSIHQHGRKARSIIEQARKSVASIIQASISEIFFTSCATEANNMIIKNCVQDLGIKRIISTPTEHHCILNSLGYLSKKGSCDVVLLDVDAFGLVNLNQLETLLQASSVPTLVSIMHGNNEIGTMAPIRIIGGICRQYGSLFNCDTVQTIGKYPINVQDDHIDFLSGSAHKFHGPKGAGFAFITNQHIISPYIHGGAQERNMRAGTENVAGIAGLAKALEISTVNMETNYAKISDLRNKFKTGLSTTLDDIKYNGNQDDNFMAHVLSVSFPPGPKAEMLVMNLDIAGISASSGSACTSGIEEDSHVLQAIGHKKDRKTIRFSFSPFNTEEEVAVTVEKLKSMTKYH